MYCSVLEVRLIVEVCCEWSKGRQPIAPANYFGVMPPCSRLLRMTTTVNNGLLPFMALHTARELNYTPSRMIRPLCRYEETDTFPFVSGISAIVVSWACIKRAT